MNAETTIIEAEPVAAPVLTINQCGLYASLSKARGEFPPIPKTRVATVKHEKGQYSYKYADLSDVFDAIDPVLSEHGLTVMQFPTGQELTTVICHSSGATASGTWPIKPMKGNDLGNAQAYQAAVQVAKRYALTAMLGISTEETVEGDMRSSAKRLPEPVNENFETGDGVRMPKGSKWQKGMTPRQLAVEAARAIEEQFHAARTGAGLSGAWDRNAQFIDLLASKQDDLYNNLLDVFQTLMDEKTEEEPQK